MLIDIINNDKNTVLFIFISIIIEFIAGVGNLLSRKSQKMQFTKFQSF